MKCSVADCNNTRNINSHSRLCGVCEKAANMTNRRYLNNVRQTQARLQSQSANRAMDVSLSPELQQPRNTLHDEIQIQGASSNAIAPPVDLNSLRASYDDMVSKSSEKKIFTDMYAMLMQVMSKQAEHDQLKDVVQDNVDRITELERKVGDSDEISERLGITIRELPLPEGRSELDLVREALFQIGAPGIDVTRDVLKAKRVGNSETNLGTVKVELRSEEVRAIIMKNKKNLKHNKYEAIRKLVISNMKPHSQFALENFFHDIKKMIPGGEDVYILRNGHLRQRDNFSNQSRRNEFGFIPNNNQSGFMNQQPPAVPMPGRGPGPASWPTSGGHQVQHLNHQQFVQVPEPQQQLIGNYQQYQIIPNNNDFPYQNGYHTNTGTNSTQQQHPQVSAQHQNPGVSQDLFDPFSSIIPHELQGQQNERVEESSYQQGAPSASYQQAEGQ